MKKKDIIVLVIIFLAFFLLNNLTPMVLDDCAYAINGRTLKDIFATQTDAYFHSNGRIISHSLVQLFDGIIGKGLFNVLNGVIDCALIWLISILAFQYSNNKRMCVTLLLACSLIWFFYPDQYITMFMVAGSSNYVLGAVLNLLTIYLLQKTGKNAKQKASHIAGLAILSFFSGAWMEMFSICIAPSLLIWVLQKKNRNPLTIFAVALYVLGACIVVLSPGNFSRMGTAGLSTSLSSVNFIARSYSILLTAISSPLGILWLITIMSAIIVVLLKNTTLKSIVKESMFDITCILFSMAFIIASYAFWPRTFFAIYTFSFVILIRIITKFNFSKTISGCTIAILFSLISLDFVREVKVMYYKKTEIAKIVTSQKDYPDSFQTLPTWPQTRKSINSNFGSMYKDDWRMYSICQYYGLEPFGIIPQDVMSLCNLESSNESLLETPDYIIDRSINEKCDTITRASISYNAEGQYMLHPKAALLLSALRINSACHKQYEGTDKQKRIIGKLLVPAVTSDEVLFRINENADNFIYHNANRKTAIISKSALNNHSNPISSISYYSK